MDPQKHLDTLLELWIQAPHPLLTEQILAVGNSFPGLPHLSPRSWLSALNRHDPTQLSPLLAQLRVNTRILQERLVWLAHCPPDPRIGEALVTLLESPPSQLRAGSADRHNLNTIQLIFELTPKHIDARHRARIQTIDPPPIHSSRAANHYQQCHKKLIHELSSMVFSTHPPDITHLPPPPPPAASALALPPPPSLDDTDAMLVYADLLQERHIPRGELIALQTHPTQDEPTQARIRQLLREHHWDWLGELTAFVAVSSVRWKRGYPYEGELLGHVPNHAPGPDFLTFTTLKGMAPISFFSSPYLENLTTIEGIDLRVACQLKLPKLTRLLTYIPGGVAADPLIHALLTGPMRLSELEIRAGTLSPAMVATHGQRIAELRWLRLHGVMEVQSWHQWLMSLPAPNRLICTLSFPGYQVILSFSHRHGFFDELRVQLLSISYSTQGFLDRLFKAIPEDALTCIRFETNTNYTGMYHYKLKLRERVARYRHLEVLKIPPSLDL